MKKKNCRIRLEKQPDGTYTAKYGKTCLGRGATVQAAKDAFFRSISARKQTALETGTKVPEICEHIQDYVFDVSSLFEYYSELKLEGLARRIGMNPSLLRQYKMGRFYISEKQLAKIEQGVNSLGEELANVKLI